MFTHRLLVMLALFFITAGFSNACAGSEMSGFDSFQATNAGSCAAAKTFIGQSETPLKLGWPSPQYLLGASDFIPCYKEESNSMKKILFRHCPKRSPWTPTHKIRNFCYATSEDCARAEMPQSWCIKCGAP